MRLSLAHLALTLAAVLYLHHFVVEVLHVETATFQQHVYRSKINDSN